MEKKFKQILLKAKKKVFTGNLGNNISTFKGTGLDFSEIKDYVIGDDVRSINWKSSAKGVGLKVNVFNEERELNIVTVFMINGSINFGTKRVKQEVMAEVLGMLSYTALRNGDNLTTLFFDSALERLFKPTKNLGLVDEVLEHALTLDPVTKKIDMTQLCHFINISLKRKSLIFLIGDFYEDIDLSSIAHKNEVYALMVRDRFEEDPHLGGDFSLVDPVTLEEDNLNLDKSNIAEYKRLIQAHDETLHEHFLMHRIKYGKIYTDDDVFIKMSQILKA
ncbi:DUF58 domain-containing protein [Sulfurospirillum sp. 1612]|uniref:DUF58 domain-containing protein n=1 Tax=Sulfurospirillum sp. 1612 TaxID=3094835 RepID=UPI002F945EFD